MKILAILKWLKSHYKIAAKAVVALAVGLSLLFGIITQHKNKVLSERLEMAQNNIEAY